jgi:hypothetical protein
MKLPKKKTLKQECDVLWSKCIHARAGGRSELTGKPGTLHAHHIEHKGNYRLRFELQNGIALTAGEHRFGVHGSDPMKWEDMITQKIGVESRAWLKSLRGGCQKTDLRLVKIHLEEKLREWKG